MELDIHLIAPTANMSFYYEGYLKIDNLKIPAIVYHYLKLDFKLIVKFFISLYITMPSCDEFKFP
jgi:hypothetical protein